MENRLKNSGFRASSSFFSSNTGLITTGTQKAEDEDIRKSRIQHLPSYRKNLLSDKLQFVVVFQTIQIERLSVEIQSLRVKLKDSQRQIRIYLNYEVQIKELTENCHQLQQERSYFQQKMEQMSQACNQLYEQLTRNKQQYEKQIQKLKRNFKQSQAQLQKQNEGRRQIIAKLQGQLLKKRDYQAKAEDKLKSMSQQLDRINQNCRQKENQFLTLQQKQSRKAQQLRRAQKELEQYQRQQQRKTNNLVDQNKRLQKDLDSKRLQILGIAGNWEKDNKLLDISKRQNEELKSQFGQLQNQYNNKSSDLLKSQQTIKQMNIQLKNASVDLARQKDIYEQINHLANQLKARIQDKSNEVQGFKKYIISFDQQSQSYSRKQADLIRKINQLESEITSNNILQEKIFQLNGRLSDKEFELSTKQRLMMNANLENKELSYQKRQLQNRCQRIEGNLRQLQDKLQAQRLQSEKQKKQIINQYSQKIDRVNQQRKQLNNQKDKLSSEIEKLRSEGLVKEDLKLQIKRLSDNCKRQEKDIQTINNRFHNIKGIMGKLKQKHFQFNQIEKTNSLLKKQLQSSFNLIDKMIQKIGAYQQQIESLTDENWRLTDKLKQEYYKDEYFSTSSSAKTIETQYNTTNTMANSGRFSNFHQVRPFDSPLYGNLVDSFAPSTEFTVREASFIPPSSLRSNESKHALQSSTLYTSRQPNVYSSMIGQYSSRGFEVYSTKDRK